MYTLKTPANIFCGEGSLGALRQIVQQENARKILVFSDAGIVKTGLADRLLQEADAAGVTYTLFSDLKAEPSYMDIEETVSAANAMQGDLIVALGGGSVMDAAKLVSLLYRSEYRVRDLLLEPLLGRKVLKSVMIPTTCGTGSEATCNAIVAVPEEKVKKGIVNGGMIPDYVILDGENLRHLPASIVASTGVDALAHTVECFTSNKHTPLSDTYASAGARLLFHNIRRAYLDENDMEAKNAMLLGAYYGGVAITGSGTTAVHALSYPLGGKYHIPHGISNAILFASVMAFNRDACKERLGELCDSVFPSCAAEPAAKKAERMIKEIADVVRDVRIPTDLGRFGVTLEDLPFLTDAGSKQTRLLNNNCKALTLKDIRELYLTCLK